MTEVTLVEYKLVLNTQGQLASVITSVNPEHFTKVMNEWNPEYENTYPMCSVVREAERLLALITRQLELHAQA